MRLKKLELIGFKSFADHAVFDFEGAVTGLVGPNGSGKSNVVDGLKWALGEQSARRLRGAEMADMIFSGSAARKSLSCAEVRLTLDNDRGLLPVDYKEVCISRRLFRSGESEYLLNGSPCRLKDIRGLVMDTGVGVSAYSVIEQGQVDMLLRASSKERRLVLEEAAGINRYLAQKNEAEHKLERVRTNLERVSDIIAELERQLRSVRYQAAKARRFRRAADELRVLRLALALRRHREMLAQSSRNSEAVAEQQAAANALVERVAALKQEHSAAQNVLETVQAQTAEAEERLSHIGAREYSLGKEAEMNQRRCAELQQRGQDLQRRRAEMEGRIVQARGELAEAEKALQENVEALKAGRQAREERAEALRSAEAELARTEGRIEEQKAAVFDLLQQESQLQNQAEMLAAQRRTLENRLGRQQEIGAQLQQQCNSMRLEREAAEAELGQLSAELADVKERQAALEEQTRQSAAELERLTSRLGELRAQLAGKLTRRQVLEDLRSSGEGLGGGVSVILDAIEDPGSPLAGCPGMLGELLDVSPEDAPALDGAMGQSVQAVVVKTTEQAREALRLLGEARKGRAEVIALDWLGASKSVETESRRPQVRGVRGLLGSAAQAVARLMLGGGAAGKDRAAAGPADPWALDLQRTGVSARRITDIVRCPAEVEPVVRALLGHCYVVDDTAAAAAFLELDLPAGVKVVTRRGECYECGRVWSGGQSEAGGYIARKSELLRLDREIEDLQRGIDAASEETQRCGEQIEALKQDSGALGARKEGLAASESELRGRLSLLAERQQQREEELELAISECAALEQEIEETDGGLARSSEELKRLGERRTVAEQEVEALRARLAGGREARERLSKEVNALVSELARIEEQQNGLRALVERLGGELVQRGTELDQLNAEAAGSAQQEQEAAEAIRRAEAERAELGRERTQIEAHAREKSLASEQARERIKKLQDELELLGGRREEMEVALNESRMAEKEIRLKLDNLLERVREESGVHLEAVELEPERWREQPLFVVAQIEEFRTQPDGSSERVAGWYAEARRREEGQAEEDGKEAGPKSIKLAEAVELRAGVLSIADAPETDWDDVAARVDMLKKAVASIEGANLDAIREQEELEGRAKFLADQRDDLDRARRQELEIIRELSKKSRERFAETFQAVRQNFQVLVRKLFGGGAGDLLLDPEAEDVLEAGIEITVRPPGKEARCLSLLSGGEKALSAVALLFAIFETKPSPFCLLDEVDATLDEANIGRFISLLQDYARDTQFVIVTHNKLTMSAAGSLYGISLQQDGTSKKVAVNFEEVDHRLAELNRETAESLKHAKAG